MPVEEVFHADPEQLEEVAGVAAVASSVGSLVLEAPPRSEEVASIYYSEQDFPLARSLNNKPKFRK